MKTETHHKHSHCGASNATCSLDFVEFSGEENNGRFLDLHAQHEVFVNLKGAKHVEYMDYVQTFHELAKFPRENKTTAQYLHYIEGLLAYLCDFHRRVFPLVDLDKVGFCCCACWAALTTS